MAGRPPAAGEQDAREPGQIGQMAAAVGMNGMFDMVPGAEQVRCAPGRRLCNASTMAACEFGTLVALATN
jgi:LSD1 subclass zinc finger protein